MNSLQIKRRGKISPQLAELRNITSSNDQQTPIATERTSAIPPIKLELPATPIQSTVGHPRVDRVPPCKPHGVKNDSSSNTEHRDDIVQVRPEHLSVPTESNVSQCKNHPLVNATKAISRDKREPSVTKQAQDQPPPPSHRETTPPITTTSQTKTLMSKHGGSESKLKVCDHDVESSRGVHGTGAGSGEEARRKRQEQQRLQKEKWKLTYGEKRESEGEMGSGEGGTVDNVIADNDDLISVGKVQWNF